MKINHFFGLTIFYILSIGTATAAERIKIITIEEHFARPGVSVARSDNSVVSTPEENMQLILDKIADMDATGIDMQVLTAGASQNTDAASSVELSKRANDDLAAAIQPFPNRFAAFAVLPTPDPVAAAAELQRAVTQLGFKGAMIYGTTNGLYMDDPRFEPIWAMAESLRVPLYIHPGSVPDAVKDAYYSGFSDEVNSEFASSGWGWHDEAGIHVIRMILAGVFDRYPNLQIISGHWGEMVPFYLARLDQRMTQEITKLPLKISEYYQRNVYVTPSGMFTLPPFMLSLDIMGADRIIYSTDTPYISAENARDFLEKAPISSDDIKKIAHENVEKLLGL